MTPADPNELTCQQVVELLTDYLGQTMAPDERARVDQHLSGCSPCTTYLGQLRTSIELTGRLDGPAGVAPPPEVLAVFRRWKRG